MSASFIPAVNPEIKAVVEFTVKGEWDAKKEMVAGVVFKLLTKQELEKALEVDAAAAKAYQDIKDAVSNKVAGDELQGIKDAFESAVESRLELVNSYITGFAQPNGDGGFDPVELTDADREQLYSSKAFKGALVAVFYKEQMEAPRKN